MKGRLRRLFVRYRDYVLIVAPAAVALMLGTIFDLGERFHAFSTAHGSWQIDELLAAFS